MDMQRCDYEKRAAKLISIAFALLSFYLVLKYAVGIILPFAAAFAVGVPINRLSAKLCGESVKMRKLCAALLVLCVFVGAGFIIYAVLNRLIGELGELLEWSEEGGGIGGVINTVVNYVDGISARLPFVEEIEKIEGFEDFRESIDEGISGMMSDIARRAVGAVPELVMNVGKKLPKFFITLAVSVLAAFYFAVDYDRLREGIIGVLPSASAQGVKRNATLVGNALKSYAKAYLLIMLITFSEVFVGLLFLGKKYALIAAAAVAVVDILPVLGAGTVLLPWSVVSFFMKDYRVGAGLLIIYGVVTIVREVLEPRIIGSKLGIHPLATLFSMFAGLSLFGFAGMLLGPCVFLVIREWLKE